jgi:hypothetical protein
MSSNVKPIQNYLSECIPHRTRNFGVRPELMLADIEACLKPAGLVDLGTGAFYTLITDMLLTFINGFIVFSSFCIAQRTHYLYGPTWGYRKNPKVNSSQPGFPRGFITSLETTLYANNVPERVSPRLAIWPGMDVAKGLIQSVLVSSSEMLFAGK